MRSGTPRRVTLALAGAALVAMGLVVGCQAIFDVDQLADQKCAPDEKPCPNLKLCVKKDDPNTGCGSLTSCTPCALPHSIAICELQDQEWQCRVAGCERKWGQCGDQMACLTDIQHDPDHCGNCTTICREFPNAFRGCSGSCTIGGCKPGFGDCNGDPNDGCEIDTGTNPLHCGRCNNPCATSCQAGVCAAAAAAD